MSRIRGYVEGASAAVAAIMIATTDQERQRGKHETFETQSRSANDWAAPVNLSRDGADGGRKGKA